MRTFCHGQDTTDTTTTSQDAFISNYFQLPMEELLNLKVTTGSFLTLDLQHSPISLTVITKDQIELSGGKHLTEILEIYVPGFQYMVNKWNGLIWGMRGVAPDRNTNFVFLVNGHKMNHESRDGAMSELDIGLLDDVERIEVLRGPGGLVYGSGAMAGVINLVTKKFEQEGIQASSKVETWGMESFGQEFQGSISRKLNNTSSIKIDVGYRISEGIGQDNSRLFGRPSWPYPQHLSNPPTNGVPATGSAQSTPGNGKIAIDLKIDRFRIYSRWTRQITNSSGWFIVDPWPEIVGAPDSTASDRWVDGKPVSYDSFFGATEGFGFNRRQYVINNISNQLSYDIPLKTNKLSFKAGVDATTNRIQLEELEEYASLFPSEKGTNIMETFGEKRYNIGLLYSTNDTKKIAFASGFDFRIYDIGGDISGTNSQNEKATHPIVTDVTYLYGSIFSEGVFNLSNKIDIHGGIRYDLHTRTARHGGVLNPKLGVIYSPRQNHTLKLIYQQSANNGSADSYEFNRNSIDDNGNPISSDKYHYENPFNPPTSSSPIIPPVTEDILHDLKPEKSQSLEIMGFHKLSNEFIALHSYSYNRITDLFAWNQTLFRIVNSGSYEFINMDFELHYNSKKFTLGVNHSIQRVVNMDVISNNKEVKTPVFDGWDSTLVGQEYFYSPIVMKNSLGEDSMITQVVNPITDGITVDGANFINLNTHVSKLYFDYKLNNWLTIHNDFRIFWGLAGRKDIHEYNGNNKALNRFSSTFSNNTSYPYLDIHKSAMIKWGGGIIIKADNQLTLSFHVYNILANSNSRNSLRWQKSGIISEHTDLFSVDQRSYAIKLNYNF